MPRLTPLHSARRHASRRSSPSPSTSTSKPAPASQLQQQSTVARGTAYEHLSSRFLRSLSIDTHRVGGADDRGVDLRGFWLLPTATHHSRDRDGGQGRGTRRLRVIAQCKATKGPVQPSVMREMTGTVGHELRKDFEQLSSSSSSSSESHITISPTPAADDSASVILLLLSASGFSLRATQYASTSPLPFFLLHLDEEGACKSANWNRATQDVLGRETELRWVRSLKGLEAQLGGGRPEIWWEGGRLRSLVKEEEEGGVES